MRRNVEAWLDDVRSYARKEVEVLLVGNKVDLYEERQVSFETAKEFADRYNMAYIGKSSVQRFISALSLSLSLSL